MVYIHINNIILMNGMCIHAVTIYNHNSNKAAGGTV